MQFDWRSFLLIYNIFSALSEPRYVNAYHNKEPEVLYLSWQQPNPANGRILHYKICYASLRKDLLKKCLKTEKMNYALTDLGLL